jgi:hypothetical protein
MGQIYLLCNKKELHEERKQSVIVPVYEKGDKINAVNDQTVLNIEAYQLCQLRTQLYPPS